MKGRHRNGRRATYLQRGDTGSGPGEGFGRSLADMRPLARFCNVVRGTMPWTLSVLAWPCATPARLSISESAVDSVSLTQLLAGDARDRVCRWSEFKFKF